MYGATTAHRTMKSLPTLLPLCSTHFDVLQVNKIGAVSFKEAPSRQARFQFLQGEVGSRLLRSGTQEGFTVTARRIENISRIVEHDAVLFASRYFGGDEPFGRGWPPVDSGHVRAGNTPRFQLNHPHTVQHLPAQDRSSSVSRTAAPSLAAWLIRRAKSAWVSRSVRRIGRSSSITGGLLNSTRAKATRRRTDGERFETPLRI